MWRQHAAHPPVVEVVVELTVPDAKLEVPQHLAILWARGVTKRLSLCRYLVVSHVNSLMPDLMQCHKGSQVSITGGNLCRCGKGCPLCMDILQEE
jgi:hypothetical protein